MGSRYSSISFQWISIPKGLWDRSTSSLAKFTIWFFNLIRLTFHERDSVCGNACENVAECNCVSTRVLQVGLHVCIKNARGNT